MLSSPETQKREPSYLFWDYTAGRLRCGVRRPRGQMIELMPPLCVTGEVAYVNATSLFWVGRRLQEVLQTDVDWNLI